MHRLVVLFLLIAPMAPTAAAAQSGEQGSVCVNDFAPGISCSGTDLSVASIQAVAISDGCTSTSDTATLTVDVTLAAAAQRYDVNFMLALNGVSAESGTSCYHDYLEPPLTTTPSYPIVNGPYPNLEPFDPPDQCGDMQSGTQITKTLRTTLLPLQISCADTNQNGTVDVSSCVSWRNGTSGGQATCRDLGDARPESAQRCSCARVEVLPEPAPALAWIVGAALLAALRAGRNRSA